MPFTSCFLPKSSELLYSPARGFPALSENRISHAVLYGLLKIPSFRTSLY